MDMKTSSSDGRSAGPRGADRRLNAAWTRGGHGGILDRNVEVMAEE
jgi:hypothetical protein